jgi:hypothetical protein
MEQEIPSRFSSTMIDFINDLTTTYPEYAGEWSIYNEKTSKEGWRDLYNYCKDVYPERFFDILYQSEDIFSLESQSNTMFLPNVDFKKLFNCEGVTTKTKDSIWKYLQLILFTLLNNIKDKTEFGESMNFFEGIDENELQNKLTEAMGGLGDFFKDMEKKMDDLGKDSDDDNNNENTEKPSFNFTDDLPNPEDIHSHLKSLFGGKLGSLAKELMEELTEDLKESLGLNPEEFDNKSNPTDIFKKLMRHPEKFMKIVQKIQKRFQDKLKSGELSQEEIMKEAGDMLRKMKEMGGNGKQMNEMFQNMAKSMGGSMGKNMKVDTNMIDRMIKTQNTKDRIRAKLEKRKQEKNYVLQQGDNNNLIYKPNNSELQEKSKIDERPIEDLIRDIEGIDNDDLLVASESKKKKKKSKKKK